MRKLNVRLNPTEILTVNRIHLDHERLVYVLIANRQLNYQRGRSAIAYIGTTKNGLTRIAASAALHAKDILGNFGVTTVAARILNCTPRRRVKTWHKLERAMLLTFREIYGEIPICNGRGDRLTERNEFDYFNRATIREHIKYLGAIAVFCSVLLWWPINAIAQTKVDIRGFYSGMQEEEFAKAINENKLKCDPRGVRTDYIRCASREDKTVFYFGITKDLNPIAISTITYYFLRNDDAKNLYTIDWAISLISSTFGVKPTGKTLSPLPPAGSDKKMDYTKFDYSATDIFRILRDESFTRADAIWELQNETYLALTEAKLGLWNHKIIRDDYNATMTKTKSGALPPRF